MLKKGGSQHGLNQMAETYRQLNIGIFYNFNSLDHSG
jgi:hypothetical protein